MAYTPTEWETGDVITAAKLNNMETGISDAAEAAAAFVPVFTEASTNVFTCNKTYAEVTSAIAAGTCDKAYVTADGVSTVFPLMQFSNGMVVFVRTDITTSSVGIEVFVYTSEGIQHTTQRYQGNP